MTNLEQTVAAALDRHGMLEGGHRVGVAVSGGADSVFLLHCLHERRLAAAVLHVNHELRGEESQDDETFVRDLATALGVPFHSSRIPVAEGNVEQEARRARYGFFAEKIDAGVCERVATGHTLDDQAETVLSRFLRGSGTAGLSGIRPVTRDRIVRPLLDLRRADIRKWLEERQIPWRQDSSNTDTAFLRNRLRLEVMPALLELNPSLSATLAATADWSQAEEVYWADQISRLEPSYLLQQGETVLIGMASFCRLPLAVQRRLLRRAVEIVHGSLRGIDFRHVEAIRALTATLEGSGRLQLPGLDVYRSFDWLRFAPQGYDARLERDFEIPLRVPGTTTLPERLLTIEMELVTGPRVYNEQVGAGRNAPGSVALDAQQCMGSFMLRNWRPGDHLDSKKIKTLFQEHRIPLWQRRHWPVITLADEIIWSRRFGVAQQFAAGPSSDHVLLVRETGESNYACQASVTLEAS